MLKMQYPIYDTASVPICIDVFTYLRIYAQIRAKTIILNAICER